MTQPENKTLFDLEDILKRASSEYWKSMRQSNPATALLPELYLTDDFFRYLSRTAIGELYEFEVLRKLRPMIRATKSLIADCEFLDQEEEKNTRQTRRI